MNGIKNIWIGDMDKKNRYRIVEIVDGNYFTKYYIQRKRFLFWHTDKKHSFSSLYEVRNYISKEIDIQIMYEQMEKKHKEENKKIDEMIKLSKKTVSKTYINYE